MKSFEIVMINRWLLKQVRGQHWIAASHTFKKKLVIPSPDKMRGSKTRK